MIALIQRVKHAKVEVNNQPIARIQRGLLVFVGIEKNDTQQQADKLVKRLLGYRVFADENDKMNLNVCDVNGELLLVSQFTLAADTRSGTRPGFSTAAAPEEAKKLFDYFVRQTQQSGLGVATGQFGADMQVSLQNDGPVTFWLQVE